MELGRDLSLHLFSKRYHNVDLMIFVVHSIIDAKVTQELHIQRLLLALQLLNTNVVSKQVNHVFNLRLGKDFRIASEDLSDQL